MTDTVRPSPDSRPVSLYLAVQHRMLQILQGTHCSLLHSARTLFLLPKSRDLNSNPRLESVQLRTDTISAER